MKKRLMSVCLCLVTLLTLVLTSCGGSVDILDQLNEEQAKGAVTLSMWVVSDKKVDKDVAAKISTAINDLTQAKYKAHLEIKYLTQSEYKEKLYETIEAYSKTYDPKNFGTAGGVKKDENGLYQTVYPELVKNQVDIVYIGDLYDEEGNLLSSGVDMYNEMISKKWLASIGDHLKNDSAEKIGEYVSPTILKAAEANGKLYGIPTNNILGEYTYMLINEDLLEQYCLQGFRNQGDIDGFHNEYVYRMINNILADPAAADILPVDATYEQCMEWLAYSWNIDPDTLENDADGFSAFGSLYQDYANGSRGEDMLRIESLFANEKFTSSYLQMSKYQMNGDKVFADASDSTAYAQTAIKFITGDLTMVTEGENDLLYYDDTDGTRYCAIPMLMPQVTDEDAFGDMFGVCAFNNTTRISTCMKIITYFNTNEEIRNLFQYGLEEEHYLLSSDGVIRRTEEGEKYRMDAAACGNLFLSYLDGTQPADIWTKGMQQNRDAVIPLMKGFELTGTLMQDEEDPSISYIQTQYQKLDIDLLTYMNTLDSEIEALLNACTTYDELKLLVGDLAILLDPAKRFDDVSVLRHDGLRAWAEIRDLKELNYNIRFWLSDKTLKGMLEQGSVAEADEAKQLKENNLYSPYGAYAKWA